MEIYLDANVFVYYCNYPESYTEHQIAKLYIEAMVKNSFGGLTSYLTWDEVVWGIHDKHNNPFPKSLKDSVILADCFFNIINLNFIKLDEPMIKKAKDLILKYNIRPRDAIHSALALQYSNGFIISNDYGLDKVKEISRKFEI